MRINNITKIGVAVPSSTTRQTVHSNFIGFFDAEVKTCATIEEGIKSFDDLEEQRRINASKPFAYKS